MTIFFLRKSHKGEFWNWTEMQLVLGPSFFFHFCENYFSTAMFSFKFVFDNKSALLHFIHVHLVTAM